MESSRGETGIIVLLGKTLGCLTVKMGIGVTTPLGQSRFATQSMECYVCELLIGLEAIIRSKWTINQRNRGQGP